ncbi:MAG: hypothetical protein ACKVQS_06790 [Fimbriimonadaceae bacterium]
MPSLVRLSLLVFLAISITGCVPKPTTPEPTPPSQPTSIATEFRTRDDLKPDVAPPNEANIILNGTQIPVTLEEKRDSNSIIYSWIVDPKKESGEPVDVESEKYFSSKDLFSFAATAHEKYDPPISLIQYPLTVGNAWDWAGDVIVGKNRTKAKAKITSSADILNLPSGKLSALLITVDLTYEGKATPSVRKLKFWFKPGSGLVRRELWGSSTREPRRTNSDPDAIAPKAK